MSQSTQLGEAELDAFVRVDRKDGTTEFFHLVNGVNVPMSREQYEQATEGQN